MHAWLKPLSAVTRCGELEQVIGLKLVANGPPQTFIGEVCELINESNQVVMRAEVIGFAQGKVFLMPFDQAPIRMGYAVRATGNEVTVALGPALLGQVVDAFAQPLDDECSLWCPTFVLTQNKKINPFQRAPITERMTTGVPALDGLLPLGKGQRMGIFAGSGVGKSSLLTHIAQHCNSDVLVIALIGERGREVQEFIVQLPPEIRAKSIFVVACSDESALRRRQAATQRPLLLNIFVRKAKR